MELKEIKNLEYFAKGKRSKVYTGFYKNKKIVVKKSKRAKIETKWLKLLNKHKIGPKFVFSGKNFLVYEFIDGVRILDYFSKKKNIKFVVKKVLEKCRVMDKLRINKKEMGNPYKHILIKGKKVKMIDFERCYYSKKPKNVTQFCQFLMSKKISKILKLDKNKLREILKEYKNKESYDNFNKILEFFKL